MFRRMWIIMFLVSVLPMAARKQKPLVPDSLQLIETNIHGISLRMRRVEGGSFVMGSTADQYDPEIYSDKPAHLVFLSPFYIAETEITYELWQAVMPDYKSSFHPKGFTYSPISYVSWFDCCEFIRRLDSITGLPFRLPTEAEWEYAARGGKDSRKYRFSGGNEPDSVGWNSRNSGNWTHAVGRKHANELGLYDMSGNVAEWCQDWYAPYCVGTAVNPCVCDSGEFKIARGGSYDDCAANSHISLRRWYSPESNYNYIGFRVAFTLPDDPMMQKQNISEPALTKKIRAKGKKLLFHYVEAEQPYYISEEITVSQWKKTMQQSPKDTQKNLATGMSRNERARFAEIWSLETGEALIVATAEHIEKARAQGLISASMPDTGKKHQSIRRTQRKRKAVSALSPWTELVGVRLSKPDDPVLLEYRKDDDDSQPLRLVLFYSL